MNGTPQKIASNTADIPEIREGMERNRQDDVEMQQELAEFKILTEERFLCHVWPFYPEHHSGTTMPVRPSHPEYHSGSTAPTLSDPTTPSNPPTQSPHASPTPGNNLNSDTERTRFDRVVLHIPTKLGFPSFAIAQHNPTIRSYNKLKGKASAAVNYRSRKHIAKLVGTLAKNHPDRFQRIGNPRTGAWAVRRDAWSTVTEAVLAKYEVIPRYDDIHFIPRLD
ncbi:hypothetical protein HDV00_009357 [Rhizophlyctis rosea]|nr:hypothetical protein HDV00_009357 [Rhizophlyctis rosea]